MGKGFNNYMCKKFFHPASRDNLKRVWMAQQKDDAYKKKQDELRVQYEKEQDLYNNKAMLSKESKDKLSVNFMYEPPPGAKKEREKEDNEPEYKFEWQRKYNAPREDYCKGNDEIQDQPFGILVRNVRCIKCRKWGHINTDKECPLYNQATVSEIAQEAADPVSLLRLMREDGFRMKKTALDAQQHIQIPRKAGMIPEDEGITTADVQFLKGLSKKEKLKLLKKLEKLEKREKKKKKKKKATDDDSVCPNESDSEGEKHQKGRTHRREGSSEESSDGKKARHKSGKKEREVSRSRSPLRRRARSRSRSSSKSPADDPSDSGEEGGRRRKEKRRRKESEGRRKKCKKSREASSSCERSSEDEGRKKRGRGRSRSPSKPHHKKASKKKRRRHTSEESSDSSPAAKGKKTSSERIIISSGPHHHHHHHKRGEEKEKKERASSPSSSGGNSSSSDSSQGDGLGIRLRPSTTLKCDYRRSTDNGAPRPTLIIHVQNGLFPDSPCTRTVKSALKNV